MKANNGSGDIPERDEWETPKELFEKLNSQYCFDFDCCANKENSKCFYWTNDFLSVKSHNYMSWMNPPFSKAKEMFEHFFEVVNRGVAIYRCDNLETEIWQYIILPNAHWIFIPKGRVVYEGMNGSSSRFPSALIGIGVGKPKRLDGSLLVYHP